MPISFVVPDGELKLTMEGTTFRQEQLSGGELDAIRRRCFEEGKRGVQGQLQEELFREEVLRRTLRGWDDFLIFGSANLYEYNDINREKFIKYGDGSVKLMLVRQQEEPSFISGLYAVEEKKDLGCGPVLDLETKV